MYKILENSRKILFAVILLAFIAPATFVNVAAAEPMTLVINGQPLANLEPRPVIVQDRMMVPARGVFERLGAVIEWQDATRSVYIRANNRILVAPVDRGAITVDGSALDVPVPAQIINDFAMVPAAAVAHALGFDVAFRDRTVFIDNSQEASVSEEAPPEQVSPEQVSPEQVSPEQAPPETTAPTIPELYFTDEPALPEAPAAIPELPPIMPDFPDIPLPEVPAHIPEIPSATEAAAPEVAESGEAAEPEIEEAQIPARETPSATESQNSPDSTPAAEILPTPTAQISPSPMANIPSVPPIHHPMPMPDLIFTPSQPFSALQNIFFEAAPEQDILRLQGVSAQNIEVESRPGTLTIRLNNVLMHVAGEVELNGNFASRVSINRFSGTTGALIVTVRDSTAYTIRPIGFNEVQILLHPPTFRNIYYDFAARTLRIPKTDGFIMDTSNIVHQDLYHQQLYNLVLPVDAGAHLGFGEFMVHDQLLRSVNISTIGHSTHLQLRGSQIFAVLVEEDDENYLIRILAPREKYARIVVLDAGHGGRFPGAVRGNVRETDLNMQIMNKLIQLIQADGSIRVYTVRNSDVHLADDLATDLLRRSQFGNAVGDIFVSLHHNAATRTEVHGIETFYFTTPADGMRTLTNRRLADIMHRHKLMQLGSHDRDVRSGNFSVLRNSQIPAVLLEFGFMSNPAELARMVTPEFQWAAARATFNALQEAFAHLPHRQTRG